MPYPMRKYVGKQPKRVKCASALNIFMGLLVLASMAWAIRKLPDFSVQDIPSFSYSFWFGFFSALALIGGSVAALMGRPNGHLIMLVVAAVFHGNMLFEGYGEVLKESNPISREQLMAFATLFSLCLTANVWATLSVKTFAYFSGRRYI